MKNLIFTLLAIFSLSTGLSAKVDTILPVRWIQQPTAEVVEDAVVLTWEVENLGNCANFEVWRYNSDRQRELIQAFRCGTEGVETTYEFMDRTPFLGLNYYEVIQWDYDWVSDTSDVVAIEYDTFLLRGWVDIERYLFTALKVTANQECIITDAVGRPVKSTFIRDNRIRWKFGYLPPGFYIITLPKDNYARTFNVYART